MNFYAVKHFLHLLFSQSDLTFCHVCCPNSVWLCKICFSPEFLHQLTPCGRTQTYEPGNQYLAARCDQLTRDNDVWREAVVCCCRVWRGCCGQWWKRAASLIKRWDAWGRVKFDVVLLTCVAQLFWREESQANISGGVSACRRSWEPPGVARRKTFRRLV